MIDPIVKRVKRRDRYPIVATCRDDAGAPVDLSGAEVRWLARPQYSTDAQFELSSTKLPGTGQVQHVLDGTLAVGTYETEVEATWPPQDEGDPPLIVTYPTRQDEHPDDERKQRFILLQVVEDID